MFTTIKGKQSPWLPVKSGVPQGSVLGPTLFVVYINDRDDNICSHILKFADDTKIFGPVATEEQISVLQQDLEQVFKWSQEWQMLFNEAKCKCLHIGHRNQHHVYTPLENTTLKRLTRKEIWECSLQKQDSTEGQPDNWHDQKEIRGQIKEQSCSTIQEPSET